MIAWRLRVSPKGKSLSVKCYYQGSPQIYQEAPPVGLLRVTPPRPCNSLRNPGLKQDSGPPNFLSSLQLFPLRSRGGPALDRIDRKNYTAQIGLNRAACNCAGLFPVGLGLHWHRLCQPTGRVANARCEILFSVLGLNTCTYCAVSYRLQPKSPGHAALTGSLAQEENRWSSPSAVPRGIRLRRVHNDCFHPCR